MMYQEHDTQADIDAAEECAIESAKERIIEHGEHLEALKSDENLLDKLHDAYCAKDYDVFHEAFDAFINKMAKADVYDDGY